MFIISSDCVNRSGQVTKINDLIGVIRSNLLSDDKVAQYFGPSGVRALPLAAGINVGGHYKWRERKFEYFYFYVREIFRQYVCIYKLNKYLELACVCVLILYVHGFNT